MYLSKIIKTDEHTYVYDALNNKFALLQSEDDIYNESKYADFLSENDFRDIKEPCEFEIKYPYSEEELEKMYNTSIKSMTLALTEQCNLRCKYCGYMPKYMDESYTLKEMSSDTAFKAIDILMKNSHESEICHVGFYGGEPLLRLNLIKECVAYIKEKYPFRKPAYNIIDIENHGVGLPSVYRVVSKYHGTVVIDDSVPERFLIRVVLYGEKE